MRGRPGADCPDCIGSAHACVRMCVYTACTRVCIYMRIHIVCVVCTFVRMYMYVRAHPLGRRIVHDIWVPWATLYTMIIGLSWAFRTGQKNWRPPSWLQYLVPELQSVMGPLPRRWQLSPGPPLSSQFFTISTALRTFVSTSLE